MYDFSYKYPPCTYKRESRCRNNNKKKNYKKDDEEKEI